MTEKHIILSDLIQTFFEKAKTNRMYSKNTMLNLTEIINQVCQLHIDKAFVYTEEEILDGFYDNGFTILEPKDKNILTGIADKGVVKFSGGNHINVNSQNISDLVSSLRKGLPLKSNSDTILRINRTKESLKQFTNKYKKARVKSSI
ncbi:MAG: hypothetical protein ACOH2D_16255 [Gelidibacter sp.]